MQPEPYTLSIDSSIRSMPEMPPEMPAGITHRDPKPVFTPPPPKYATNEDLEAALNDPQISLKMIKGERQHNPHYCAALRLASHILEHKLYENDRTR